MFDKTSFLQLKKVDLEKYFLYQNTFTNEKIHYWKK